MGDPPGISDYKYWAETSYTQTKTVKGPLDGWLGNLIDQIINPYAAMRPTGAYLTPEEAKAFASQVTGTAVAVATAGSIAAILAETLSLGQIEAVDKAVDRFISLFGLNAAANRAILAPLESGVFPAIRQYWNSVYKTALPDPGALASILRMGQLSRSSYLSLMGFHGYEEGHADLLSLAALRVPDVGSLYELRWRGRLTDADLRTQLQLSRYDPSLISGLMALQERIPGPGDLIRFYVREAYLPEMQAEVPDAFLTDMAKQGYGPGYTKLFWGAHWVLVPLTQLYEMFHRGIITYEQLTAQLKYHDYTLEWRDRLIQVAYNLLPRVDVRRAYAFGEISAPDLTDYYGKLGYSPEDRVLMANIARRMALSPAYTRYASVGARAFRQGQINAEAFRGILESCNFPEEYVALMVRAEELARAGGTTEVGEEPRILTPSQVLSAYGKSVISLEVASARLSAQGFDAESSRILLAMYTPRPPAEEPQTILGTAVRGAYRRGAIPEAEARALLEGARYPPDVINLIITAEDLNRLSGAAEAGEEPRVLTPSQVLRAYSLEVLSRQDVRGRLLAMEFAASDVEILLAMYAPKPPEAPRGLTQAQVLQAYTRGVLDAGASRTRLLEAGIPEADVDVLMRLSEPRPEVEAPSTALVSAASDLYREGFQTREEYKDWLRRARLTKGEIADRVAAEELRYMLDWLRDQRSSLLEAYRKDLLDAGELTQALERIGVRGERADTLVALEVYKKLPRPRAA